MFNYSVHRALNDVWYSPPFFTTYFGYKLQLGVHANGYGGGLGTHLSVSVYLMKGENDFFLKWPFRGNINIQLLNWKEDKEHIEAVVDHYNAPLQFRSRVTQGERAPSGRSVDRFLYNLYLNDGLTYLFEDALCFRVSKTILLTGDNNSKYNDFCNKVYNASKIISSCKPCLQKSSS